MTNRFDSLEIRTEFDTSVQLKSCAVYKIGSKIMFIFKQISRRIYFESTSPIFGYYMTDTISFDRHLSNQFQTRKKDLMTPVPDHVKAKIINFKLLYFQIIRQGTGLN